MRKLARRVCSHTEPPPPQGSGKMYDICAVCVLPISKRPVTRMGHANEGITIPHINTPLKFADGTPKHEMIFRRVLFRIFRAEFKKLEHQRWMDLRNRMRLRVA